MDEGYILTDTDELFLEGVNRDSLRFACHVSYVCGLSVGYSLGKRSLEDDRGFFTAELSHGFKGLRLLWYCSYGVVGIQILVNEPYDVLTTSDDLCFIFLGRGERLAPVPVLVTGAGIVEKNLCKMLDGIMLVNRFTLCQSGLCFSSLGNAIKMCRKVGDKWLCDDCIDRFSLEEPLPQPQPQATCREQTERIKLTPGLRWDILCRDNFTCRTCGRSPRKGDDVKLHVDHIKPIHHGGLTTPDNLQVLCQDCNLGKSAKWSRQMELTFEHDQHLTDQNAGQGGLEAIREVLED